MSLVAGWQQGADLNNPEYWNLDFMNHVLNSRPYVMARAIAWALISFSNIFFLLHLMLMVAGLGRRSNAPTLLHRSHGHDDTHTSAQASHA
jgi:cytochrome c oxidase cbb3-type subunit 1